MGAGFEFKVPVLVLESPERLGWHSEECPQRMGQFIVHYRTQFAIQLDLLSDTIYNWVLYLLVTP